MDRFIIKIIPLVLASILRTMARDKDIIILKKVIKKQQVEIKGLEKGNRSLMESRIKWKNRYYKEKAKNKDYISKDKIRDYFAPAISDYNRGKFDTIEDLLERLEDNKWN